MAQIDHGAEIARKHLDPRTGQAIARSPEWPRVERAHRARQPTCAACIPAVAGTGQPQVHHVFPFHYCIALGRPDLELDDRNLITLCETEAGHAAQNHHLLVGHLDDWQSSNLDVIADAAVTFHGQSAATLQASAPWLKKKAARLKPLEAMNPADKRDFTARMNARFPLRG